MAISTYSELKSAVASWTHRTDLTSVIDDFIDLAEAKFNRDLRTRQQETDFSATTPVSYEITIPSDFAAVRKIWRTSDEMVLEQQPLDLVRWNQVGGESNMFAIGDVFVFDGTSEISGVYYAKITALSDSATTNWLLTAHPDLYLSATLAEASFYTKDPNASAMWTARADALIKQVNMRAHRDQFSGPVRVVAR